MFKIKKKCASLTMILAVCIVVGFSATHSIAQTQRNEVITIQLTKDARSNGYEKTVNGNKTYLKAVNVVDPSTNKLLELINQLEFRCRQSDEVIRKPVRFERGNSKPLLIPCEDIDGEALAVLVVNSRGSSILIVKNVAVNGYKITAAGADFDLEAKNVVDPVTKKQLKGLNEIRFRCLQEDPETIKPLLFTNGDSEKVRLRCREPLKAEIYVLGKSE